MSITVKDFVTMLLPSEAEALIQDFGLKDQYKHKNAKVALRELFDSIYKYDNGCVLPEDYLYDYKPLLSESTQQAIDSIIEAML